MRITITEPAFAHPRLPEPGERAAILAGGGFSLPLRVVSAERHGDEVTVVLDFPNADLHLDGEAVDPRWQRFTQPAGDVDGVPVFRIGTAGSAAA